MYNRLTDAGFAFQASTSCFGYQGRLFC